MLAGEVSSLLFLALEAAEADVCDKSGDFIQLMWPHRLPRSCILLWVMAAALHLALIFSTSLQRPNKPDLGRQLLFCTFIPVSRLKLN